MLSTELKSAKVFRLRFYLIILCTRKLCNCLGDMKQFASLRNGVYPTGGTTPSSPQLLILPSPNTKCFVEMSLQGRATSMTKMSAQFQLNWSDFFAMTVCICIIDIYPMRVLLYWRQLAHDRTLGHGA